MVSAFAIKELAVAVEAAFEFQQVSVAIPAKAVGKVSRQRFDFFSVETGVDYPAHWKVFSRRSRQCNNVHNGPTRPDDSPKSHPYCNLFCLIETLVTPADFVILSPGKLFLEFGDHSVEFFRGYRNPYMPAMANHVQLACTGTVSVSIWLNDIRFARASVNDEQNKKKAGCFHFEVPLSQSV